MPRLKAFAENFEKLRNYKVAKRTKARQQFKNDFRCK